MYNIYLDFDGVINVFSKNTPRERYTGWKEDSWKKTTLDGYPILYSTELVDYLNDLSSKENISIIWLTTWRELASTLISPALGINGENWEYLSSSDEKVYTTKMKWWKLEEIEKHVASTNPDKIVWIDDELRYSIHDSIKNMDSLSISPDPCMGVTKFNKNSIDSYLNKGK